MASSADGLGPMDIPPETIARLKRNESAQPSRAKAKNKKIIAANNRVTEAHQISLIQIEKVDIIDLFNEQTWTCQCHRVPTFNACWKFVEPTKPSGHPDSVVIGHLNNMDNGGHHLRENLGCMRHECNMKIAHTIEVSRSAKTERLSRKHRGVKKDGKPSPKRIKKKIPQPKQGMQSKSKWPSKKTAWPKRKFGQ